MANHSNEENNTKKNVLKFGKPATYTLATVVGLSTIYFAFLSPLAMAIIDKAPQTKNKSQSTKWALWGIAGLITWLPLVMIMAGLTPGRTEAENQVESAIEQVVEDKRQCTEIENDLITSSDSLIGASIHSKSITISALEASEKKAPSQAQIDKIIQSMNKQTSQINSYTTNIATLSQEYGDACSDSRREAFTAENLAPRQQKLLALAGEVEVASEKISQLEAKQKEKAELERITPEQRAAVKALYKYNFIGEASLPEVRAQKQRFELKTDLGVKVHNENNYGDDPILQQLKKEAKAEVVRMDNDIRAQKVQKYLANGTTISAKSNYDLIKGLEPDHPAVARFAKSFETKAKPVVKEEPKQAAPTYKSAKVALREICEAGVEYSKDGIGTPQQIAHELAYWVIDLHKETGGKASEAALRKAGSDGYMYESCSNY